MITYKEFEVIRTLLKNSSPINDLADFVYRNKHYYVFKSIDEVTGLVESLKNKGYLLDGRVTASAMKELESLKVKNAVILAAGGSETSSKSIYSMPKGLFIKEGETLIERQIRQLKETGIDDITVVVGYKQEMYFFLMEKWGVKYLFPLYGG